ncbi:hypothetical protein BDV97DRAFT_194939 [Delphinella strobiligena]|nr:hypothetical protein BDV97DRAFT_194939 [Delphinella strobiligena]
MKEITLVAPSLYQQSRPRLPPDAAGPSKPSKGVLNWNYCYTGKKYCPCCLRCRRLLQLLSSQTSIIETITASPSQSDQIDISCTPHRYYSCHCSTCLSRELSPTDSTAFAAEIMSVNTTYDLLWSHQILLMREIETINQDISAMQHTLSRAKSTLSQSSSPRKVKKKAQWALSKTSRALNGRENDRRIMLQNLAVCQAQIAAAHEAAQGFIAKGESAAQGPFTPLMQTVTQRAQSTRWNNAASTGPETGASVSHYPLSSGQEVWDLSRIPHTPATPSFRSNFTNLDGARRTQRRRDSGFSEPPLYAQPFDFGPATAQHSDNHVFSHEMMVVSPLSTAPTVPASASTIQDVGGASATDQQRTKATDLNPAAKEFTDTPGPSPIIKQADCGKKATTTTFALPDRSLDIEHLNPTAASFSPTSTSSFFSEPNMESLPPHKRRYSLAAIDLIESRMRQKDKLRGGQREQEGGDMVSWSQWRGGRGDGLATDYLRKENVWFAIEDVDGGSLMRNTSGAWLV